MPAAELYFVTSPLAGPCATSLSDLDGSTMYFQMTVAVPPSGSLTVSLTLTSPDWLNVGTKPIAPSARAEALSVYVFGPHPPPPLNSTVMPRVKSSVTSSNDQVMASSAAPIDAGMEFVLGTGYTSNSSSRSGASLYTSTRGAATPT